MFHTVSVATLLTYKHSNTLRDGRSINIAKTLAKNAGMADTVKILKFPNVRLKNTLLLLRINSISIDVFCNTSTNTKIENIRMRFR